MKNLEFGASSRMDLEHVIRAITAIIQATPKQVEKATERAIRKTSRWVASRTVRELSNELGIPQRVFKNRLSLKRLENGYIIWLGLRPLSAQRAGQARQTRRGVRVGQRQFQHAFLNNKMHQQVWIRESKNQAKQYTTLSSICAHQNGSGRFPIHAIGVAIDQAAEKIFSHLQSLATQRFETLFQQELNYATQHEKID